MKLIIKKEGNLRMLKYKSFYSSKLASLQRLENTAAKFQGRTPEKLIIGKQVIVAN